jgi:hypothetical protein
VLALNSSRFHIPISMLQSRIPQLANLLSHTPPAVSFKLPSDSADASDSETAASSSSIIRGSWSNAEDEQLRKAVTKYGTSRWDSVALVIESRTPTQCRERWMFRIGPGLNKTPFEPWEDDTIILERARVGNHWAQIARELPGRTSCAVKNRWYSALRHVPFPVHRALGPALDAPLFSISNLLSRVH